MCRVLALSVFLSVSLSVFNLYLLLRNYVWDFFTLLFIEVVAVHGKCWYAWSNPPFILNCTIRLYYSVSTPPPKLWKRLTLCKWKGSDMQRYFSCPFILKMYFVSPVFQNCKSDLFQTVSSVHEADYSTLNSILFQSDIDLYYIILVHKISLYLPLFQAIEVIDFKL